MWAIRGFILIWKGAMRKLTSDHSPVGESEDAGELTEQDAMQHPRRNEVFRDVGSRRRSPEEEGFIELRSCRFHADAAILLCSDGLTDLFTSAEVRYIVDRYEGDAASVAGELVEAANLAGGCDNITALFVAGASSAALPAPLGRDFPPRGCGGRRGLFTGRAAFLVYGLLLAMLVWVLKRECMERAYTHRPLRDCPPSGKQHDGRVSGDRYGGESPGRFEAGQAGRRPHVATHHGSRTAALAIQREMQALDLRVVEIYEIGDQDGYFFVAMQYIEGRESGSRAARRSCALAHSRGGDRAGDLRAVE